MGSNVSRLKKKRVNAVHVRECYSESTHQMVIREIVLKLETTFVTQMVCWEGTRFCLTSEGNVVLYGVTECDAELIPCIHIYTRSGEVKTVLTPPPCDHNDGCHDIEEIVANGNRCIAVSCSSKECKAILLCGRTVPGFTDVNDSIAAYSVPKRSLPSPGAMCMKDSNSLLAVLCNEGSYSVCVFDTFSTEFYVKETIPIDVDVPCYICYVKRKFLAGIVIVSKWERQTVAATCLVTGESLWRLRGEYLAFVKIVSLTNEKVKVDLSNLFVTQVRY